MSLELAVKVCSRCKTEKPLTEFYRMKSSKDGRRPDCRECAYESVKRSQARLRADIGDAAYRALKRDEVRRHRSTPKGREAARLHSEAYRVATAQLRHAHPEEFAVRLRQARYDLGLPVEVES